MSDEGKTARVDPDDYSAFYLWSGVQPPRAVDNAQAVYLLWGELRRDDPGVIVPLRRTVPTGEAPEIWLVVRAERLDWSEQAYEQLMAQMRLWDARDTLAGVQIDFDARTAELGGYARFLSDLRGRLKADLKLSATGLMDWPANASDESLTAMRGALDEIVIQTYQATDTVPDYARYLAHIRRLDMPYRIAIIEDGEWSPPAELSKDPNFNGYVVFLLGERVKRRSVQKP